MSRYYVYPLQHIFLARNPRICSIGICLWYMLNKYVLSLMTIIFQHVLQILAHISRNSYGIGYFHDIADYVSLHWCFQSYFSLGSSVSYIMSIIVNSYHDDINRQNKCNHLTLHNSCKEKKIINAFGIKLYGYLSMS